MGLAEAQQGVDWKVRQARLSRGELDAEYLAGTISKEDCDYLRNSRSTVSWIELQRQRYRQLTEEKVTAACNAVGPDKPTDEKLDAVITLLAIIARA